MNPNKILSMHYFDFRPEIVEKLLSPLKIKDSVPKYKSKIILTLNSWTIDNELIESVANYTLTSNKFSTKEDCLNEIQRMIYFIIDTYSNIESDLIDEVDKKNRQYTKATARKIEYLLNSDDSFKGNIITLIKAFADENTSKTITQRISSSFDLFEAGFIDERSVYEARKYAPRKTAAPVEIVDDEEEFKNRATADARRLMKQKFSREKIFEFVNRILGDKPEASTSDISVNNDDTYIMTLLAVAHSNSKKSPYTVEILEDTVMFEGYAIPKIIFRRKS